MSYEKYQNVGMVKERYNENSSFQQQQQHPQSHKQMKVTFIDDLPELEDIENRQNSNNEKTTNLHEIDDKFKKYIRNDSTPHEDSGMVDSNQPRRNQQQNMFRENTRMNNNPPDVNYHHYHIPTSDDGLYKFIQQDQQPLKAQLSCVDIAEHVQNCPVCGKLYKNDNTMYIGIITILVILCILLVKRVLEVPVEK